jgi:hypothetical protein
VKGVKRMGSKIYGCKPISKKTVTPISNTYEVYEGVIKGKNLNARLWSWMVKYLVKKGVMIQKYTVKEYVEYESLEVELDKIAKAIVEDEHNLRCYLNRDVDEIICGRDVISGLEKQAFDLMVSRASFEAYMRYPGQMRLTSFEGMRLRIVPWFKGVLVVPKER